MIPVICFGEALIDFLNISTDHEDKLALKNYRQYPGGAPANAAVAVAKLGGNAFFAGQVGKDAFGDFLISAMQSYGVDVSFVSQHPSASTALAFVMLDENNDRSFSFYRDNSADVLFNVEQIDNAWFKDKAIFHFCSNTLTTDHIADCTETAAKMAIASGATVSFDVNLRHNLWSQGQADIDTVNQLVRYAHVIKFSAEEFDYLANGDAQAYQHYCFSHLCQLLMITDGEKSIRYITRAGEFSCQPPEIIAVDTTAGGDGFIGAFLFMLSLSNNIMSTLQNKALLAEILIFASCCGAIAVSKAGAFPALSTFEDALLLMQSNYHQPSSCFQKLCKNYLSDHLSNKASIVG